MNSPPLITSRANRRRALSLDNPATPLLGTIARRKSDKREQDEAAQRIHRMHVVSGCQCWSMYAVVALLSLAIVGIVFYARRPNAFTPSLPDMSPGQTLPGQRTHILPRHLQSCSNVEKSRKRFAKVVKLTYSSSLCSSLEWIFFF